MSRQLIGSLINPDGSTLNTVDLLFVALESANGVLQGTEETAVVDVNGNYSITLINNNYGVYSVHKTTGYKYRLGNIVINTDSSTTVDTLLEETSNVLILDFQAYVEEYVTANVTDNIGVTIQAKGDYLPTSYVDTSAPTDPSGLTLVEEYVQNSITGYSIIKATWTASSDASVITYYVRYRSTAADPSDPYVYVATTTNEVVLSPAEPGVSYDVYVKAVDNFGNQSGEATNSISIVGDNSAPSNVSNVTGVEALQLINISWTNPSDLDFFKVKVHGLTYQDNDFVPSSGNLLYEGFGSNFTIHNEAGDTYWLKFITEDFNGNASAASSLYGPFDSFTLDETNIGRVINANSIKAQQIAPGEITEDLLAAKAVVASKLAILDVTNLVENHTFEAGADSWTTTTGTSDFTTTGQVSLGTDASSITNNYTFPCVEGEKLYASALITGTATGTGQKGVKVVFYNSVGTEISAVTPTNNSVDTGYITDTTFADSLVDGFVVVPANAVTAAVRLFTDAVTAVVVFQNIICRHGAAVYIENGEITASQINVADLFAGTIEATGTITGATIQSNTGIGTGSAGVGFSTAGLYAYNSSDVQTAEISSNGSGFLGINTGSSSYFSWNTAGSGTLHVNSATFDSSVTVPQVVSGKSNYADVTAGYFVGLDSSTPKMHIGDASTYIKWTGSALEVNGDVTFSNPSSSRTSLGVYSSEEVDTTIAGIQNQIDGNITTWFYSGVPTLVNSPAVDWTDDTTKDNHLGDLYYDDATGYAYRFAYQDPNYVWIQITDSDITTALANAATAQDTADSKRRVFVATPNTISSAYEIGDLWDRGSTLGIWRCITSQPQSGSNTYDIAHWQVVADTTNDNTANDVDYVNGVLSSTVQSSAQNAWGKFSGAGNTLPSGNVEFNFANSTSKGGNATNTDSVGSSSASDVSTVTINFNGRNDRDNTSITTPTIASDGTAIDHTVSTDGSCNISFEWSWAGTDTDIDGWIIYIRQSTSGTSYNFGTTAAEEQVFYVTPEKRAYIMYGVPVNLYYTFGIQAYRIVDPDVNANGVITSTIVQPSLGAEDPYQPSSTVAFGGDITGTVNSVAVGTLTTNAFNGNTAYSYFSTGVLQASSMPTATALEINASDVDLHYAETMPTTINGLFLGNNKMGFLSGNPATAGDWKTYMDNTGNFYLGGTSGALRWDGAQLTVTGSIESSSFTTGASGNQRVEINASSSNELRVYDSSDALRASFGYSTDGSDNVISYISAPDNVIGIKGINTSTTTKPFLYITARDDYAIELLTAQNADGGMLITNAIGANAIKAVNGSSATGAVIDVDSSAGSQAGISATAATGSAVYGTNATNNPRYASVYGENTSTVGGVGVGGYLPNASTGTDNFAVMGELLNGTIQGAGVYGLVSSGNADGVRGINDSTSGAATGVYGQANNSNTGIGVEGVAVMNGTSVNYGVKGSGNYAVYGDSQASSGYNTGVYGRTQNNTAGRGVYGVASTSTGGYGGVFQTVATTQGAPLRIVAAASSSAPTHSAALGSLWVTSAGVLYINTSGSTTWQKVGAQ